MPSAPRASAVTPAARAQSHASRYRCDRRGQVELLEAWLRSAGFNPALIALQARTPPQDMAILTAAQLRSNGVDFVLVDRTD